jgi:GTP-binding protein
MKVTKAEYVASAVYSEQFPQTRQPEIVFAGRSNVGKSSLINMLTGRKKLAYFSQKPGKTQTINFYNINDRLTLVDVPGYGYAKVSAKIRAAFGKMMETYFSTREQCVGVCLLLDIRHNPTADDKQMVQFLAHYDIPLIILLTKADKLGASKQQQRVKEIRKNLALLDETVPFVLTSAEKGLGKEKAWSEVVKKVKHWQKERTDDSI